MSRYPEADEAQHRNFNDGYNPYHSQYEPQQNQAHYPATDPFATPQSQQQDPYTGHYAASPPPGTHFAPTSPPPQPYDPYGAGHYGASSPLPPAQYLPHDPYGAHSPPPQDTHDYLATPFQPPHPTSTPLSAAYARNAYSLADDGPVEHGEDEHGDMPLLRRDPSSHSGFNMPVPGDYIGEDDGSVNNNIRYGRIPQRVPRRYKTIKRVELFHGNFVLDSPVPKKLLDMCANRTEREFSYMRYSAATCDPNDFKDSGFTLLDYQTNNSLPSHHHHHHPKSLSSQKRETRRIAFPQTTPTLPLKRRRQACTWNAPSPADIVHLLSTMEAPRSGAEDLDTIYRRPANRLNLP
ncbi:chitin synthase N-terminal-domain-containing protein [Mycena polygramma]|nr:chitin synthase N-terminal-domain-containing protein [Mycena polygramma]